MTDQPAPPDLVEVIYQIRQVLLNADRDNPLRAEIAALLPAPDEVNPAAARTATCVDRGHSCLRGIGARETDALYGWYAAMANDELPLCGVVYVNQGPRCLRPLGHEGLHADASDTIWSDGGR